jgi:arsenate reductase (glutaredoxin)
MTAITIYHNPNCTTSRNTLALIRHCGIEPSVVEYLKTPLNASQLADLVRSMGVSVRDILRQKGTPYDALALHETHWTDAQLLDFVVANPILMNRPIVVSSAGTKLCRPSEEVLALLPPQNNAPFVKEDGEVVVTAAIKHG